MEVKRLPPEEEPGAPGAYGGAGSIDGKIPGRFWINLRTTDLHSKYSLADLTFHEAIPGHIWQGEYTHEMPLIRQMLAFNAYSEGWALYAEQLADELGAYDERSASGGSDTCSRSRSARAGWSSTPASTPSAGRASRACSSSSTSTDRIPQEVASEVDRYCSWPGQACGYKVGHSEINRQRERAKTALGVEVRPQGVQRHRRARRQRAARRARQERRRIHPDRQGLAAKGCAKTECERLT